MSSPGVGAFLTGFLSDFSVAVAMLPPMPPFQGVFDVFYVRDFVPMLLSYPFLRPRLALGSHSSDETVLRQRL
jgi:hypothetical protein